MPREAKVLILLQSLVLLVLLLHPGVSPLGDRLFARRAPKVAESAIAQAAAGVTRGIDWLERNARQDEKTAQIMVLIVACSLFLMAVVTTLVILLLGIKIVLLVWDEDTRRAEAWMRPLFEDFLRGRREHLPIAFFATRWPLRRVLQYMIVYRSFGTSGATLTRIAWAYEKLGFVRSDLRRLRSPFWWTRAEGARCLGQMKAARAKPALLDALRDDRVEVRLMAAWSLGRIGDPDVVRPSIEALVAASRLAGMRLSSTVFELGAKAVAPLVDILDHRDASVRLLALHLLGELRAPEAMPPIVAKTRADEGLEVRIAAVKALGTLGHDAAYEDLRRLLRDRAWQIRAQAAKALGLLGAGRAVGPLEEALLDARWWVRRNAGEALTRLGEAGRAALTRAAGGDTPERSKNMAEQWLDELGPGAAAV